MQNLRPRFLDSTSPHECEMFKNPPPSLVEDVDTPKTFCQTLAFVLQQRGNDIEDMRAAVDDGTAGVAAI